MGSEPYQIAQALCTIIFNSGSIWATRPKDLTPALRFAGNQSLAERRNPLCYDSELHVKGSWNEAKGKLKQKYGTASTVGAGG
jgi:hypothetical protein